MYDFDELYDLIIELGIADEEELNMAVHFGGKFVNTLNEVIFYKRGYRDIRQFLEDVEDLEG